MSSIKRVEIIKNLGIIDLNPFSRTQKVTSETSLNTATFKTVMIANKRGKPNTSINLSDKKIANIPYPPFPPYLAVKQREWMQFLKTLELDRLGFESWLCFLLAQAQYLNFFLSLFMSKMEIIIPGTEGCYDANVCETFSTWPGE